MSSRSGHEKLPVRLAEPGEDGTPFREWLSRRADGDRRTIERQIAFLQQWDNLRDEDSSVTPTSYSTRWRVSVATTYRLLEEFRELLPSEQDPDRLLELLWEGLSERYLGTSRLGSLMDVRIVRRPDEGDDLRDILPPIVRGQLEDPLSDGRGANILPIGTPYEAYETKADRFAWSALSVEAEAQFVSFILEQGQGWVPASGSAHNHEGWDQAEMASAARWAMAQGMRLVRVGVRVPSPPGEAVSARERPPTA
jgi:hypothetical protein